MKGYRNRVEYKNVFLEYARILNGYLRLTERELQVFSWLLKFETEYIENEVPKNIVKGENRKVLIKETYVTRNNLVKYINKLKKQHILVEIENNRWEINPELRPEISVNEKGGYQLATQFILEIKDEQEKS